MNTPQNTTQFMNSVMQKLRAANQVSRSNNLSTIANQGNGALGNQSVVKSDLVKHKTANGLANRNDHSKETFDINGYGIKNGQGLVTDQGTRETLKYILTPIGTIADIADELTYGVGKAVEGVVDAVAALGGWIGSLFGADDQWAKDFIAVDGARYVADGLDFVSGGWATQLAFGESLAEQSGFNYIESEKVQDDIRGITSIVGEIIPSLVLAYFTGGSNLGVQIAAQGGLAFGEAMGQSVESEVVSNPNVELGSAVGYGALKGTTSAALTALTVGIGGSVASKGGATLVDKASNAVFEKTGSLAARTLTKVGLRGASAYLQGQVNTLIDPLERQITVDNEAIEKAYGSNQAVMNTLKQSAENGLKAAIISATITAVQEGVNTAKAGGVQQYKEQLQGQIDMLNDPKLQESLKTIKSYNDERSKICKQLASGKINEQQFNDKIAKLDLEFNKAMVNYEVQVDRYSQADGVTNASKAEQMYGSKGRELGTQYLKGVGASAETRQQWTSLFSKSFQDGKTFKDLKASMTMRDLGTIDATKNQQYLSIAYKGQEVEQIKVVNAVVKPTTSQLPSTIAAVSSGEVKNLPATIQLPKSVTLPNEKPLLVQTSAIKQLVKAQPNMSVKEITLTLKDIKNVSYISDAPGNKDYQLVKKVTNNDGSKFVTYTVQPKTNKIKSITISAEKPQNIVRLTSAELENIGNAKVVKMAANSLQGKVTTLKTTTDLVKHTKNLVEKTLKDAGFNFDALTYGSKNLPRVLFNDINLRQDYSSLNKVVKSIFDSSIKVNGETLPVKDILPSKILKSYKTDLVDVLTQMVKAKETPTTMSQMIEKFNKKIESLVKEIGTKDELLSLSKQQIEELKDKSKNYRNATIEVNRAMQNIDLTKETYNLDKKLYKTEIENDGTIKTLLKSLPRRNMIVSKEGNIRYSDTDGLYLSEKYSTWAKDTIGTIKELIDKQAFINLDADELLSNFEVLAYGGDEGSKHLNVLQLQSLTNIMKALRWQVSDKANEIRAKRREVAKSLHNEQKIINKFVGDDHGATFNTLAKMGYDNVKLMALGDMITGVDNSELQQRIDKISVESMEKYDLTEKEFDEKYLQTKDMSKLGNAIRKSIKFQGHKINKGELLSIYEQLSDSETYELFAKKGNYIKTSTGGKIMFSETLREDIADALGINIISLDKKAIIDGIYNDRSEGSYIPRVQKYQIEHKGFSTIPDRDDYVPRKQANYNRKDSSLENLDKNEAKAKATTNNSLKERTQTGGKLVLETYNPIEQATKYLGNMNKSINITDDINEFLSYFELTFDDDNVQYKAKETYGDIKMGYLQDLARTLDDQSLIHEGITTKLAGFSAGAALGGKFVFGPIKNYLSVLKQGNTRGIMSLLRGINPVRRIVNNEFSSYIKSTGTWYTRYKNGLAGALANTTYKGKYGKIVNFFSFMYEVFDKDASLMVANTCLEYVKKVYPDLPKQKQFELARDLWIKDVNMTQSTAKKYAKSSAALGKVLGAKSEIVKASFAFQSDTVAGSSMVIKDAVMAKKTAKIIKETEKVMNDAGATQAEKETAKKLHEQAIKTKKRLGKAIPAGAAALLTGAVLKYLITDLEERFKGKKQWTDSLIEKGTIGELLGNTAESFIPFFSTIYSAIKYNDGKTELFAFGAINDLLGAISDIANKKTQKGLFNLAFAVTSFLGIPVKTIYNDVVAVTNYFDPETAIKMKNLLYGTSDASNVRAFSNSVKNGNDKQALAYLSIVLENRVGETTDALKDEIFKLYKETGISIPRATMESYVDENGNSVTLTDLQKVTFRNTYSKANSMVDRLLKNSIYTNLSSELKSKALTNVYNAYYELAKSKVIAGYVPSTRLNFVFAKTDGKLDINSMSSALAHIGTLEETKKKTRKELAIKYVNSLNCERGLKLLILKLSGFGLSEKESKKLETYLKEKGMSKKEVKEFLK